VKPFHVREVAAKLPPDAFKARTRTVVSFCAGLKLESVVPLFPGLKVVRFMPNLAVETGAGIVFHTAMAELSPAHAQALNDAFSSTSLLREIAEEKMDEATVFGASVPAYAMEFVDALLTEATARGWETGEARAVFAQVLTSVVLQLQAGANPRDVIQRVATPKGVTAAGLEVMAEADFTGVMRRALAAAINRNAAFAKG